MPGSLGFNVSDRLGGPLGVTSALLVTVAVALAGAALAYLFDGRVPAMLLGAFLGWLAGVALVAFAWPT